MHAKVFVSTEIHGHWVFIETPIRGLYKKTHRCVVEVVCPHCGAAIGDMCKSSRGYLASETHWARRIAASKQRKDT